MPSFFCKLLRLTYQFWSSNACTFMGFDVCHSYLVQPGMHPASSLVFKCHKGACCEITLVEKVMSANSADGGTASKAASKPLFTSSRKSAPHVRSTNAIYKGCPGTCPGTLSLAACIPCAVYLQAHVQTASRCSVRLTVLCRQLPAVGWSHALLM